MTESLLHNDNPSNIAISDVLRHLLTHAFPTGDEEYLAGLERLHDEAGRLYIELGGELE